MLPSPDWWRDENLPQILRSFATDRGPYLKLALTMAADEIERLREKLTDQDRE
jgi:hypothetical protein